MMHPKRPARPCPDAGALLSRLLAAAACLLTTAPALAPAAEEPRPASNMQQAQAKFAAQGLATFAQAPVLETVRAAFARRGEGRLTESVEAFKALTSDIRLNRPADVAALIRNVIVGGDDGTNCPVAPDDPYWIEPPTALPAGGRTRVRLSVRYAESLIGPDRVRHRSYNGALVGPVIRVRRGESLFVDLANNLPPDPPRVAGAGAAGGPDEMEKPHGYSVTNLHTHGLHVSPRKGADDVFLELAPGDKPVALEFKIPEDHPAGTFWYHPHKHGSAALQLCSGMAGALIVEDGIDEYPGLRGVAEKVMVFQQFIYRPSGKPDVPAEVNPADIYTSLSDNYDPNCKVTNLINGQLVPVISMRPGEVQRWRMIHSGVYSTLDVNLSGHEMTEIAYDGIPLKHMRTTDHTTLQPGYRADVLVKASDKPGVYCIYSAVGDPNTAIKGKFKAPSEPLARVVVEGKPAGMALPEPKSWTDRVEILYGRMPDLKDIHPRMEDRRRTLDFKFQYDTSAKVSTIDGKVFQVDQVRQLIPMGTVEEWTLRSSGDNHPFHIHINPFQVQVPYPDGAFRWVWRDTLLVTPQEDRKIRHRFAGIPGKTVLHCHNIDHEDQGMMEAICIVNPDDPPDPACPKSDTAQPPSPAPAPTPAPSPAPAPVPAPVPAPAWRLKDAGGREVASADSRGRRLLVFHRGFRCGHCAEQVALLGGSAGAFRDLGIEVMVVSPGVEADGKPSPAAGGPEGLTFLRDPTLDAFRAYGCLAGGRVDHGVFLVDGDGLIRWGRVGDRPEMDIALILENGRRLAGPPRGPVATSIGQ